MFGEPKKLWRPLVYNGFWFTYRYWEVSGANKHFDSTVSTLQLLGWTAVSSALPQAIHSLPAVIVTDHSLGLRSRFRDVTFLLTWPWETLVSLVGHSLPTWQSAYLELNRTFSHFWRA